MSTLKPRVFVDADVLFAGAASPSEQGASLVVLRLSEITLVHVGLNNPIVESSVPSCLRGEKLLARFGHGVLVEAISSEQAIDEAGRNLAAYLPATLPLFQLLVSRCLRVVSNPTAEDLLMMRGLANPKDAPILAAAVRESCSWLVSFNVRHFQPGYPAVRVVRPGEFVQQVRSVLAGLGN